MRESVECDAPPRPLAGPAKELFVKGVFVSDKPSGAKPAPGKPSAPPGEDHIVNNLQHLFRGVEEEELPERFRKLLEELGRKEQS